MHLKDPTGPFFSARSAVLPALFTHREPRRRRRVWHDALLGAVGGLAGAAAMNVTMLLVDTLLGRGRESRAERSPANLASSRHRSRDQEARATDEFQAPATEQVASLASHLLLGRGLTASNRQIGIQLVHFGYGALAGAAYAALARRVPRITTGYGTAFGTALWAGSDLGALPLLGLSKSPRQISPMETACAASAHLAYGMTLETVRRNFSSRDSGEASAVQAGFRPFD